MSSYQNNLKTGNLNGAEFDLEALEIALAEMRRELEALRKVEEAKRIITKLVELEPEK